MNHKGKNGLNLGSKDSRKNVQPEMLISALENIPRWLSSMCLRRRLSVSVYERAFFGDFRLDKRRN